MSLNAQTAKRVLAGALFLCLGTVAIGIVPAGHDGHGAAAQALPPRQPGIFPWGEKEALNGFYRYVHNTWAASELAMWNHGKAHEEMYAPPPRLYKRGKAGREYIVIVATTMEKGISGVCKPTFERGQPPAFDERKTSAFDLKTIDEDTLEGFIPRMAYVGETGQPEVFSYRTMSAAEFEPVLSPLAAWLFDIKAPWAANRILAWCAKAFPEHKDDIVKALASRQFSGNTNLELVTFGDESDEGGCRIELIPAAQKSARAKAFEEFAKSELDCAAQMGKALLEGKSGVPLGWVREAMLQAGRLGKGSAAEKSARDAYAAVLAAFVAAQESEDEAALKAANKKLDDLIGKSANFFAIQERVLERFNEASEAIKQGDAALKRARQASGEAAAEEAAKALEEFSKVTGPAPEIKGGKAPAKRVIAASALDPANPVGLVRSAESLMIMAMPADEAWSKVEKRDHLVAARAQLQAALPFAPQSRRIKELIVLCHNGIGDNAKDAEALLSGLIRQATDEKNDAEIERLQKLRVKK